ncbi:glucose-1-phosphate adenylyltransferase GlgC [Gottschalkia acidurici 9a]|uniref:Glucose-1-phosphate adenylyltransferase n=1 Tax=Gottschalkia acidurici (strain ATCC 7906 / DSM 604 / BCRC 14475 / CIP 104303 / KCTC 5404 / NCIMB 10678 / 9a) TaxID=1128398 RepID=K0AZ54_GOTA9|nr:glucose-1-phosphate adenylyltransferase [Gottschalkia acidurici]AFS77671.1 glucose-1-phosphate adenylyltransferase GlgC [Gottschalkia acidurici 9a]
METKKKECIAMILAGGQGSRLGTLTKNLAKPAVPFGGKYRIIDFTLSNCSNSGIDTVGILTQYQPLILNSHIGIGRPWDLDRRKEGVTLLPPYVDGKGGEWYKGTANAIYQNIYYIDQIKPEYVIVLSGDHIYKMNYSEMINYHKESNADATISVIEVPLDEASRFGIMNTDNNDKIYEFEEKPKEPKNNLASMGIYIFNWDVLRQYLIEDENNSNSSHDFGKDIIPKMVSDGKEIYAYRFKGYWKDVGTIESFWEANMDLLSEMPELSLYESNWKIYSENTNYPPSHIAVESEVNSSLINEGCSVSGKVKNSILFQGVSIGRNSVIKDSLIFPNVEIGDNVTIEKAIIGENSKIYDGKKIGQKYNDYKETSYEISQSGILVIGENSII